MTATFTLGQLVRVEAPGRRAFEAPILALRQTAKEPGVSPALTYAVDVRDPRNGGLKTVALEHVEPVRPTCEACGREIPKGRRRHRDEADRLVCGTC